MKIAIRVSLIAWFGVGCGPLNLKGSVNSTNLPNATNSQPSGAANSQSSGDFTYEINTVSHLLRYLDKKIVISREQFVRLLAGRDERSTLFRRFVNKSIANLPTQNSNGFMLKAPVISKQSGSLPFYFYVMPSNFSGPVASTYKNYFFHCDPQANGSDNVSADYTKNFLGLAEFHDDKITIHQKDGLNPTQKFQGASALYHSTDGTTLISPCPFSAGLDSPQNSDLLHIRSFAVHTEKNSQDQLIQAFWGAIGNAASEQLMDNKDLFLNTHGHGVNYLHFRVDLKPKYYDGADQLLTAGQSESFYQKVSWK